MIILDIRGNVCGFSFHDFYGELGNDFIEPHHIKTISETKEGEKNQISSIYNVLSVVYCNSYIGCKCDISIV